MEKHVHFEILSESLTEGMVLQNHEGKIVEFNTAALKILGLTPDQMLGKTSYDPSWKSFREDGTPYPKSEHPAVITLTTGKPLKRVLMGVSRADNELRWFYVNTTPVFNENLEKPDFVLCTFIDVTEERKLLHQVQKSEAKFKALFEEAPLGMVELDEHKRCVMANLAFQEMVGYNLDELKIMKLHDITHPEDIQESKKTSDSFDVTDYSNKNFKKKCIKKNGEIIWVQVSSRTIEVEKGAPHHVFAVIENITEQKKLEDNFKAQEAKLIHASKMSALGEMAAGMAHEINNPLAIIAAYAGVLRSQIKNEVTSIDVENIRKKLVQIEGTVERIAKIVRGLKQFSRSADLDPKLSITVKQVIEDTLIFCQERFKNKRVELRLSVPEDLTLTARPNQITQVLLNLLNNSYDSIQDAEHRWIEISAKKVNNKLKIKITDSGKKIPPEIRSKMMLPFFTTKEVGRGTGLGLSISQGLVENHGGKLYYDETAINNSFKIELPYEQ